MQIPLFLLRGITKIGIIPRLNWKSATVLRRGSKAQKEVDQMEPNKTPDTEAVPAEEAVPSEAELKKKKRKKRIISLICYALTLVFLVCMLPALIGLILHSPFTPFDTDPESLARIAPIDEEAAASIDAMPAYSEDDTWAVYVYLVGSNLESSGMNELSLLTEYLIDSEVSAIVAERGIHSDELLSTFVQDVTSQGVDLPQILYRPSTASYQTHDDEAYEAEGAPQDARLGIARYDAKSGDIEYYGEDVRAFIDEDGSVRTDFNGSWLQFGGHPLPLEVMSDTGEYVMYSSNIQYNALPATLITGYSAETGEVSVLGVRLFTDAAGLLDRSLLPLRTNDLITICYQKGNLDSNVVTVEEKSFLYREGKTKLEEVPLSDGTYYEYILFEDLRCDTYYSPIASLTVKGGNITDQQLDTTLFGYDKS